MIIEQTRTHSRKTTRTRKIYIWMTCTFGPPQKDGTELFRSKDKDVSEKEYQNIYRLVLTGAMRLNKDLWDEKNPAAGTLRENNYYDNEMDLINNGTGDEVDQIGYQKSRKRFKHRQTEKALLGAVKAWSLK